MGEWTYNYLGDKKTHKKHVLNEQGEEWGRKVLDRFIRKGELVNSVMSLLSICTV